MKKCRYAFGCLPLLMAGLLASATRGPAAADEATAVPGALKVADGFTVELVAGPPLVDRPITMAFDDRGRLYVSDSSGSNDPLDKQLAERPHRVLRLEDSDGDGRFDRRTVFADQMMFPEGTMWFRGSLYVSAVPSIWKLTDADDDGVAEKREEWFAGTMTPCGNDLHGPYLGRDGWIYWCKGAFAEQTHDLPKRPGWKSKAAHIFARPDGSGIEPVLTGGMDNPVDVAFTPAGERILSCTFLVHSSNGQRDGLIHAIYGGTYGKDHAPLDGQPRTGELMPPLLHMGPAAPCGLHYCESRAPGDDLRGNLLACQFNYHKVTRSKLIPVGASYRAEESDFLSSESTDFHPTDVIEDADGSLLVCDTGGWYKLCCPSSQFHRPNVLGAIYRIRRTEAAAVKDPRGLAVKWEAVPTNHLAGNLGDERPAVRERMIELLAARGKEAVGPITAALSPNIPVERKLAGVWTLSRIDDPAARQVIVGALVDASPEVRQAAAHVAGVWRDPAAVDMLCRCLSDPSPAVARAAAEALGRIGNPRAAAALLAASPRADDRILEHSLIYALYEIGDAGAIRPGLTAEPARTRRTAMLALSQLAPGDLTPGDVLPLLTSPVELLRDAAWWIAQRRADWGEPIAAELVGRLHGPRSAEEDEQLQAALAQLARNATVQQLLVDAVGDTSLNEPSRLLALRAMARGSVSPAPDVWVAAVVRAVESAPLRTEALASLQALGLTKPQRDQAREALVRLAADDAQPAELRLVALETLGDRVGELSPPLFAMLVGGLTDETPPLQRAAAASVLAQANLNVEQQLTIAGLLDRLAAFELTRLLPIFEKADEAAQRQALQALAGNDNPGGIRRDVLTALLAKLPEGLRADGDALMARVDALNAGRRQHLEDLYHALPDGDVDRGHAIFNSRKTACIGCHAVGYVGGRLGPDLTLVGKIRTDRDLLEAIIYPSASFVRSFEPLQVVTNSGQQFSGLLKQESPAEIVLATGPLTSERIPRDEIEEIRPGQTSLMPEGLEKLLSVEELGDLIAYLKSRK